MWALVGLLLGARNVGQRHSERGAEACWILGQILRSAQHDVQYFVLPVPTGVVSRFDRMNPSWLTREHEEPFESKLPPFALDRQRIVHSSAFRRLQFKTQVFVTTEQDHFRTRLTHTLEVANLARCLARAIGADVELAEVVALAHDLGHPPFGHAGERALDACMKEHGGFEHNAHSLRVVEYLEHPYPPFRGLNLTRAVRECLAKHSTRFDRPGEHPLQDGRPPPLEGQLVALADRLAFGLHDLQDGLYAGWIDPGELDTTDLWRKASAGIGSSSGHPEWRARLRPTIDRLQFMLVADVAAEFQRRCADSSEPATGSPRRRVDNRADLSKEMRARYQELEGLIESRVYRHPDLRQEDTQAESVAKGVFGALVAEPGQMPARFADRVAEQGAHRVVADYVAGMTDRFCDKEYARLIPS